MAKVITKNKAVDAPHFGYTVQIKRRCDHSERSEEEYGSWSSSYTNTIDRLVKKVGEYPDVTSTLDLPPGTNALVVWAEWSSGDSFGNGTRSGSEAFGIFLDMASARAFKEELESGSVGVPWDGYFESLDSINIDPVVVF